MKALILAAGYGTRLQEVAKDTPKALLPIGEKPISNHILDRIKDLNELNEIIIITNDKFYNNFVSWAEEQKDFPFKISVVNDGTRTNEDRLGSIGDIEFAIKQEEIKDDVLVVGGDNLFDFNLDEYIHFAQSQRTAVTIGLYDIESLEEATKFGVVGIDGNKKIVSFVEKPAEPRSTLIAMCFYYLPKNSLNLVADYLAQCKKSDTAGDYIRWLHEESEVYGFKFSGKWYDIGSIESYNEAQEKFKK
ncbi:MAG: nucleotidyltransferase family protein [Candidatus Omnitrophica bacterium]|nr:nucleotidyltransferase family protein [Candidatus Omnitrophota bacterium]MBU1997420.1 nucleotidyltransferase family protein [Candidatus Omnitrophota bacterium]MBU4332805.1 nucleotidyltransferase family protein [Candidatus Omnitrophota bacterium]